MQSVDQVAIGSSHKANHDQIINPKDVHNTDCHHSLHLGCRPLSPTHHAHLIMSLWLVHMLETAADQKQRVSSFSNAVQKCLQIDDAASLQVM